MWRSVFDLGASGLGVISFDRLKTVFTAIFISANLLPALVVKALADTAEIIEIDRNDWIAFENDNKDVKSHPDHAFNNRFQVWIRRLDSRSTFHNFLIVELGEKKRPINSIKLVHTCLRTSVDACGLTPASVIVEDLTGTYPPGFWLPHNGGELEQIAFINRDKSIPNNRFSAVCDIEYLLLDLANLWENRAKPTPAESDLVSKLRRNFQIWRNSKTNCPKEE